MYGQPQKVDSPLRPLAPPPQLGLVVKRKAKKKTKNIPLENPLTPRGPPLLVDCPLKKITLLRLPHESTFYFHLFMGYEGFF